MRCRRSAFDRLQKTGGIFLSLSRFEFVGFGESNRVRATSLCEPLNELKVDALWFMARVDQHKNNLEIGPMSDVFRDDLLECRTSAFWNLCIAVSRKVYEARAFVDAEEVDQLGAAGSLGDAGKGALAGQKIEKR